MLQLKNIQKIYKSGENEVVALKDINLTFRENEFVSILGPSGCGKTTTLNIIGGLDQYTSGDLIINGVSTKEYKDADWDAYRNNSIGFVFQSYNLIPHQTVLSNVELAMTLAGVSKEERRSRAIEVLEKVGLGDQLDKKPNQMSGGQMQRVAIARALVNNPDILLADEPTGALDSETSIQIMNLLKEIAEDRLIIMVTHNPELAEEYSTRIVHLFDGEMISDSDPCVPTEMKITNQIKKKKVSMSFFTALALSFKNLLTKKTRTLLTAFAGSIGIIGIALIMSLSNGMQTYIDNMEKDTLSNYPITIQSQSLDIGSMMISMMDANHKKGVDHPLDKVYSNNITSNMIVSLSEQMSNNNLEQFKAYIDSNPKFAEKTNAIQYGYDLDLQIYANDKENILQVNPSDIYEELGFTNAPQASPMGNSSTPTGISSPMSTSNTWGELLDNQALLDSQYDILAGHWPQNYNEVVIAVDENNEISDSALYALGLMNADDLENLMDRVNKGEEIQEDKTAIESFNYDELLNTTFKLLLNTDYYIPEGNGWTDKRDDNDFMRQQLDQALELKVVGIIRPNEEASSTSFSSTVGYTQALMQYVIDGVHSSDIAKEQLNDEEINVLTGEPFDVDEYIEELTMEGVNRYISSLPEQQQVQMQTVFQNMSEPEIIEMVGQQMKADMGETATYESNLLDLGIVDLDNPSSINLYPTNFEAKDELSNMIEEYNDQQEEAGHEEYVIHYTDVVGIMISSISSIIDIISYILIAFVAISLIVSSIMIGIITYISVLERTKEIGILRSIGASKRDISRVFNAETVIEGLFAGIIGVLVSILLTIPINMVVKSLVGVSDIASLPIFAAIILILISVILTVVAGFIPAKVAAKKDPVEALRSE